MLQELVQAQEATIVAYEAVYETQRAMDDMHLRKDDTAPGGVNALPPQEWSAQRDRLNDTLRQQKLAWHLAGMTENRVRNIFGEAEMLYRMTAIEQQRESQEQIIALLVSFLRVARA
jgi:hypothetical protein